MRGARSPSGPQAVLISVPLELGFRRERSERDFSAPQARFFPTKVTKNTKSYKGVDQKEKL